MADACPVLLGGFWCIHWNPTDVESAPVLASGLGFSPSMSVVGLSEPDESASDQRTPKSRTAMSQSHAKRTSSSK